MKKKEYDSEFTFTNIQLKSIEKVRLFSSLLDQMEKEFGIRTCKVELMTPFICWDISEEEIDTLNKTPMEKTVRGILKQLQDFN